MTILHDILKQSKTLNIKQICFLHTMTTNDQLSCFYDFVLYELINLCVYYKSDALVNLLSKI